MIGVSGECHQANQCCHGTHATPTIWSLTGSRVATAPMVRELWRPSNRDRGTRSRNVSAVDGRSRLITAWKD